MSSYLRCIASFCEFALSLQLQILIQFKYKRYPQLVYNEKYFDPSYPQQPLSIGNSALENSNIPTIISINCKLNDMYSISSHYLPIRFLASLDQWNQLQHFNGYEYICIFNHKQTTKVPVQKLNRIGNIQIVSGIQSDFEMPISE